MARLGDMSSNQLRSRHHYAIQKAPDDHMRAVLVLIDVQWLRAWACDNASIHTGPLRMNSECRSLPEEASWLGLTEQRFRFQPCCL